MKSQHFMDMFTLGQLVLAAVPKEALPEAPGSAFLSAGLRKKDDIEK